MMLDDAKKYALTPGTRVGDKNRYEILGLVGNGSCGLTYRAMDRTFDREIALKECFPVDKCWREGLQVCVDDKDKEDYERATAKLYAEGKTLAQLKHPGVVTVHDAFIDARTNSLFIAMEWLSGDSLESRTKKGPVPHDKAEQWLRKILDALRKVHGKDITHRDIKPANIVFDDDDNPVLVDFGAALNRNTKVGPTIQGPYTERYAAPEQLDAKFGRIGQWTDFYALAATWYEMLTRVAYKINPRLSIDSEKKALVESVMKNLAAEPEKRCQSADEWLSMLDASPEPDAGVEDVRCLVGTVWERYPRENEGLPVELELLLRMVDCMHLQLHPYEKLKALTDAHEFVHGVGADADWVIASVGSALGWSDSEIGAVQVCFREAPGERIVHGASRAVLKLAREYFWKEWPIWESLCGVSAKIRSLKPDFWRENKEIFGKYGKHEKTVDDVRWVLNRIKEFYPEDRGFPGDFYALNLAVDMVLADSLQARREKIASILETPGREAVVEYVCRNRYGNLDALEAVRKQLADDDAIGLAAVSWLGLPQSYFAQVNQPEESHVKILLQKIHDVVKEVDKAFWAANKSWLCQIEPKK